MLTIFSLDHAHSSVAEREPFALPPEAEARLGRIARRATGCQVAFLVTCNRVELIVWSEQAEPRSVVAGVLAIGRRHAPGLADRFLALATCHRGDAAVRHLLRVAAGLASRIEGDVQALGQVRAAYAQAAESGGVGAELHRIFQTALRAGKRVHHDTEFGRRRASVGTAAAEVVAAQLPELNGAEVLLLGAGKAAEAAARALVALGARLTIGNRDGERAESFAREVGATVAPFEARHDLVARADAAILATGAREPILTSAALHESRVAAGRVAHPLLLLDLGFPRNADDGVAMLDGVTLLGLQDLAGYAATNVLVREAADEIVEVEARAFRTWLGARARHFAGAA